MTWGVWCGGFVQTEPKSSGWDDTCEVVRYTSAPFARLSDGIIFTPAWSSMQWLFSHATAGCDGVSIRGNKTHCLYLTRSSWSQTAGQAASKSCSKNRPPQHATGPKCQRLSRLSAERLRIIPNAGVALSPWPLLLPTDCWWTSTEGRTAPDQNQSLRR